MTRVTKEDKKQWILIYMAEHKRDEHLEWYGVLDEHLGKKAKGFLEERRIE